ncbi:MAG: FtsX-like permease family protein [Planctomycetota bacterium]
MTGMARLIRLEATRRPLSLLVVGLLCCLGGLGVSMATGLVEHLSTLRLRALMGSGEERTLRVRAPDPEQGPISNERTVLTPADIAFFEQLDGLESMRIISGLPIPASMRFHIPRLIDTRKDLTLYSLRDDDVPEDLREAWHRQDEFVPLILNPRIIALYNLGLADRYNKPRLRRDLLRNLVVQMQVGADAFDRIPGAITEDLFGIVIGFSSDVPVWGAGVPKRLADQWLTQLFPERPPGGTGPILATLRFDRLDALVDARRAIVERDLPLEGQTALAEGVLKDRAIGTAISAGLLVLVATVLAIGAGSLTVAIVGERRLTLALYRSLGARLPHLLTIFASGLVLASALGALVGVGLTAVLLPPLSVSLSGFLESAEGLRTDIRPIWLLWAPLLAGGLALFAAAPIMILVSRRPLLADLRGA